MKNLKIGLLLMLSLLFLSISSVVYANTDNYNSSPTSQRIASELLPAFLASQPLDFEQIGVKPFREHFSNLVDSPDLPSDQQVRVYNLYIPNPDNGNHLRLRIYQPVEKTANMPGIYWIHGGGFLFGVPEQDEAQSIRFAKEVGAVVVAVDYRLAPEYPYPVALNDSYAGLVWFCENAEALGVDNSNIAIAGASAGGGLCAAVTLMARDKGGPALAFQMPLYPMIDDRFNTLASRETIDMRVWNNISNRYAWKAYLGDFFATDKIDAYMAPARAKDLSGLPPTYTCVGNLDPFRDDTINYVTRLVQAGVPVEFHLYPGAYHAFEAIAPNASMSKQAVDEYIKVLKQALVINS